MAKKAKKTSKTSKTLTSKKVKQENSTTFEDSSMPPTSKFGFFKFLIFALLILIGLAAIFFGLKNLMPGLLGSSHSGELAAKVNQEEITMVQLEKDYASLPPQYQMLLTKEAFLDQLIEQKLLSQEATRLGISPTQEEIQINIDNFLSQYNMTKEELEELLKNRSMTQSDLEDISREQLISQAILKEILKNVSVSTEEALAYYNANAKSFEQPEEYAAKHIMFAITLTNRTAEQAHSEALEVMSLVNSNKSNFCELVTQFSDDMRSVSACGQYSFIQGQMPAEFERWSMKAKPGDISVVDTEYGSHVILFVGTTPEKITLFKDVQDQIISALKAQKEKIAYQDFVKNLRENAVIINYLKAETQEDNAEITDLELDVQASAEMEAMQQDEEVVVIDTAPAETGVETQPVVETKPTTTVNVVSNQFSKCFLAKSPVLYGAQWDSSTIQQKNVLGDYLKQITYVECFKTGEYKTPLKACSDLKISAYPTWRIGGQTYLGVYNPKQIETLVGC